MKQDILKFQIDGIVGIKGVAGMLIYLQKITFV